MLVEIDMNRSAVGIETGVWHILSSSVDTFVPGEK